MSEKPDTPTPPPARERDEGGRHAKAKRIASEALRILLLVALWVPQPVLFFGAVIGSFKLPDWYGFLGSGFALAVGAFLIALTFLIVNVGRNKKASLWAGATCAVVLAIIAVNHFQAQNALVQPEDYDVQTASNIHQTESAKNLELGAEAYRPFSSNLIARLNEPSSLQFARGDVLPRVDSATALLPFASSVVTATYPREGMTVQWEQGDFDLGFIHGYKGGYIEGANAKAYGQPYDETYVEGYEVMNRFVYKDGSRAGFAPGYASGFEHTRANSNQVRIDSEAVESEARDVLKNVEKPEDPVFQYNNSSEGFTRLADRRTDVFFGTKSDSKQQAYAADAGVEFEYTPIGREGFVFLVNASNPVESLTVEQVKGIYSGRYTNWSQLGGDDEPIMAYQRNEDSGSQSMMRQFMGSTPLSIAPFQLSSGSMGGLVASIANYDNGKGAIGYSFRYYVTDLVGKYDVKLLAIEGVSPTLENIGDESYPITGDFYAVTRAGDDSENLRRLLAWLRGPQGQELVEASGYARLP